MSSDMTSDDMVEPRRRIAELEREVVALRASYERRLEALEASERRYRELYENAPLGFQSLDGDGRFVEVNPSLCDALGYGREELIGRWFGEYLTPASRERFTCGDFSTFKALGELRSVPFDMVNRRGEVVSVEVDGRIAYDDRGGVRQTHCVIHDVTRRNRTKEALRHSERRFQSVIDASPVPFALNDEEQNIIYLNSSFVATFGYTLSDIPLLDQWWPKAYPDPVYREWVAVTWQRHLEEAKATGRPFAPIELTIRCKDGSERVVIADAASLTEGFAGVHLVILYDITERKRIENRLNETLATLTNVINSTPDMIFVKDRDLRTLLCNRAYAEAVGKAPEEMIGRTDIENGWSPELVMGVPERGVRGFIDDDRDALSGMAVHNPNDPANVGGEIRVFDTHKLPLRDADGEIIGVLGVARDITERKRTEERIDFLAYHDPLTRLPNRLLARDRMEHALSRADRDRRNIALLFIDLDDFKDVNNTLGHAFGDELLVAVTSCLIGCVRKSDTVSRQGGDEFLIIMEDVTALSAVDLVCKQILQTFEQPFTLDGHDLVTSMSIGVAVHPADGNDFDTLFKKADAAMYQAKRSGKNTFRFYTEQMNVDTTEYLNIRSGLKRALEGGELFLQYQPQIDLEEGRVIGVEALIRWSSPEFGLVPPNRFIPVAEESGLIVPIGEWVLEEACRQAVAWHEAGYPRLTMAVNLSTVQFQRGDLESAILGVLSRTGMRPELLELELTESILIRDSENVLNTVSRLKSHGILLSIDDFGTGYSSLSYLKRFSVDKLKIDQSFIRDMTRDPSDAAIVRAVIQMAKSLGLRTIAEGVEDERVLTALRGLQCDEVQGYLFSRPLDAGDIAAYLNR